MISTGADIHVLRDPTRGGLGTSLHEIAKASKVGIRIVERDLPVPDVVANACSLLGLDPLYVANEGKLVAFVPAEDADRVLQAVPGSPVRPGCPDNRPMCRRAPGHGHGQDRPGRRARHRPAYR